MIRNSYIVLAAIVSFSLFLTLQLIWYENTTEFRKEIKVHNEPILADVPAKPKIIPLKPGCNIINFKETSNCDGKAIKYSTPMRYGTYNKKLSFTKVKDIGFDFSNQHYIRPLRTISEDGGDHDPRIRVENDFVSFSCPLDLPSSAANNNYIKWIFKPASKDSVALLFRRDDHNPFFMISLVLNMWIVMHKLKIEKFDRIIFMDEAKYKPTDELFSDMAYNITYATDYYTMERFENAVVMPSEYEGPLMDHLDSYQPCEKSQLVKMFAKNIMKVDTLQYNVITIVSRKNYNGRHLNRIWLNEDIIVARMRSEYPEWIIEQVQFEKLSMKEQIKHAKRSKVMLGMHGAGMVHCIWMNEGSKVIEIFPKQKIRHSYRNIAQYVGLNYYTHRGGIDSEMESKTIDWDTLKPFLDKIIS